MGGNSIIRGPEWGTMSIPQFVKASLAVAGSESFVGRLSLHSLPRLREALGGLDAELDVDLRAYRDATADWLAGSIAGELQLLCCRCLEPYAWQLQAETRLRLVGSESEEQQLLQDFDPYWVQDDRLQLHRIVEDEALLALPMMGRCPVCAAEPLPAQEHDVGEKRPSMLAQLKNLKL